MATMTKLSVNVNKLATIRNSRGKNNPNVLRGALDIVAFGGQGVTVHPRPDGRHIRREDVYEIDAALRAMMNQSSTSRDSATQVPVRGVEFNIEGYPSDDFLAMLEDVRPDQATLVPDPPEALTSNAGWKVTENLATLRTVANRLNAKGIRISVFVDPQTMQDDEYAKLASIGIHRVELYTERFADEHGQESGRSVLDDYKKAAQLARSAGLGVNAGHDLNLDNLTELIKEIPWIDEVSIGHALICDALYFGLEKTVQLYLDCIRNGQKQAASQ
jgi:pyridoxine 5-phosphate synthase